MLILDDAFSPQILAMDAYLRYTAGFISIASIEIFSILAISKILMFLALSMEYGPNGKV